VADRAHHLVFRPEMLEDLGNVLARIEIEGRAAAARHVDGVVLVEIDILQLHGRVQLRDQLLVRKKSLTDQIFRFGRIRKVRIAVGVVNDLAAGRTRKINFDSALGQVPVRVGDLR
jgi:hypothetical protein